jgi:hypothetical protein
MGSGTVNTQKNARLNCRKIYKDAQTFFDRIPRPRNYGFKILYAPPFYQPPILFIGYQPGGDDDDWEREAARGSDKNWPAVCEYATESWKLAKVMRHMFGRVFLESCVGVNAIFIRSPTVTDYNRAFDKKTRAQIKTFCLASVVHIVEAIVPQKIVAIGFDKAASESRNGAPRGARAPVAGSAARKEYGSAPRRSVPSTFYRGSTPPDPLSEGRRKGIRRTPRR